MTKNIAAEWDRNAGQRALELENQVDRTYYDRIIPQTLNCIRSSRKENPAILDVGCGLGYLTHAIQQQFSNVCGIDMAAKPLEMARARFPGIDFIQQELGYFGLQRSGYYDLCLAIMVLHNTCDLWVQLSAIHQLLKTEGQAIIALPHPQHWYKRFSEINYFNPQNALEKKFSVPFKLKDGSCHPSTITYFHRTLTTYIQTIEVTGFQLLDLIEIKNDIHPQGGSDLLFLKIEKAS